MVELEKGIPGGKCALTEGAVYAYASVEELMGKYIDGTVANSSSELAAIILDKAEVAVVPGEAFGTPGFFRLSYATSDENITEGISRMHKLLASATD